MRPFVEQVVGNPEERKRRTLIDYNLKRPHRGLNRGINGNGKNGRVQISRRWGFGKLKKKKKKKKNVDGWMDASSDEGEKDFKKIYVLGLAKC